MTALGSASCLQGFAAAAQLDCSLPFVFLHFVAALLDLAELAPFLSGPPSCLLAAPFAPGGLQALQRKLQSEDFRE